MRAADLQSWAQAQTNQTNQTDMVLEALSLSAGPNITAEALPTSAFVTTLMSRTSLAVLCPVIPSDGSQPASVVFPGCPCNATGNAYSFRCPGGYRCSAAAYHGLDSDVVLQPALGRLRAVCVPCSPGQFCPLGTFVKVGLLDGKEMK